MFYENCKGCFSELSYSAPHIDREPGSGQQDRRTRHCYDENTQQEERKILKEEVILDDVNKKLIEMYETS